MAGPWLQSFELVAQPDLLMSSPDRTLAEVAPMLNQVVGVDVDSGVDVRRLKAVISTDQSEGRSGTSVVIGSQPDLVLEKLDRFAVVEVGPGLPGGRLRSRRNPMVVVGGHGFSDTAGVPETSFSMQTVDDWGIDDVMASALDLASRQGRELAVMFDLAVLDPAFDDVRTTPGGLDLRKLFRAARSSGRRPDVAAAGFVKAGSDINLVHAVLAFCAGLAGR